MQRTTAMQLENFAQADEGTYVVSRKKQPLADKRNFVHKRMDRWIRLQQFVFGLPEDYSYAICATENLDGTHEARTLIRVGWMSWYGQGVGADRQHALAVALLNTTEALSTNSTNVFWYRVNRIISSSFRIFKYRERALPQGTAAPDSHDSRELMAG